MYVPPFWPLTRFDVPLVHASVGSHLTDPFSLSSPPFSRALIKDFPRRLPDGLALSGHVDVGASRRQAVIYISSKGTIGPLDRPFTCFLRARSFINGVGDNGRVDKI